MSSGIFLIKGTELVEMSEEQYVSEDYFQQLLEKYPNLLAGNQINNDAPRRWLLVNREAGIPDEQEGAARWSVDHLFLDQDGIPTLVEVKRSTDTRIRREVVGQMLDYASNVSAYWSTERIQLMFEDCIQQQGQDQEQYLLEFLDGESSIEEFWSSVDTNIKAGKLRLLFVADKIPKELQRIIEFLNHQMDPAEVLGVEIKQYIGDGETTLVPRVLGQTIAAQQHKKRTSSKGNKWTELQYLEWHKNNFNSAIYKVADEILRWTKEHFNRIWWGQGSTECSYIASQTCEDQNKLFYRLIGAKSAYIHIQFGELKKYPEFEDPSIRKGFLDRFNQIPGIQITEDKIDKYPAIKLDALIDDLARSQVLDIFKDMKSLAMANAEL